MSIVQIKIKKDDKAIAYIKIIREFDSSVPMGEIKKRIEQNDYVHEFDLDARDWIYLENMTEYQWHQRYLVFLKELEAAGAKLEIYRDGKPETMKSLKDKIRFIKEIYDDCEKYPD